MFSICELENKLQDAVPMVAMDAVRDARRAEATLERNKPATARSTKTVVDRTKIAQLEMSEYERRYWQTFGFVLHTYHAKGRSVNSN